MMSVPRPVVGRGNTVMHLQHLVGCSAHSESLMGGTYCSFQLSASEHRLFNAGGSVCMLQPPQGTWGSHPPPFTTRRPRVPHPWVSGRELQCAPRRCPWQRHSWLCESQGVPQFSLRFRDRGLSGWLALTSSDRGPGPRPGVSPSETAAGSVCFSRKMLSTLLTALLP